jgi:hypothetical protein
MTNMGEIFDIDLDLDDAPVEPVKKEIPKIPEPIKKAPAKEPKPKEECSICGKEYANLKRHMDKEHPEKPEPIAPAGIPNEILMGKLDRVLELAQIGKAHELSEESLIYFAKVKGAIKPYELRYYFHPADSVEIQKILNKLLKDKVLNRNRDGWYKLAK